MHWAENFYALQDQWASVYSTPVQPIHERKLELLEQTIASGARILELGAGGGQFGVLASGRGYDVTAIERIPSLVEHGEKLREEEGGKGSLRFIIGDFYQVDPGYTFDGICYWDGFGLGEDRDQRQLLKRMESWLHPHGQILLDVYTPWYWARQAGRQMRLGNIVREYAFQGETCRFLDYWYPENRDQEKVFQSLRCYSPPDLKLLLQGTGLCLMAVQAGGCMNYTTMEYRDQAPLEEAMMYTAWLQKEGP